MSPKATIADQNVIRRKNQPAPRPLPLHERPISDEQAMAILAIKRTALHAWKNNGEIRTRVISAGARIIRRTSAEECWRYVRSLNGGAN